LEKCFVTALWLLFGCLYGSNCMFGYVIGIRRLSLNFVIVRWFLTNYPSWNKKKIYEIFSFHSLLLDVCIWLNLLIYNCWQLCPFYLDIIKHYNLLFVVYSRLSNFFSYPAVFTITGDRVTNLHLCLALAAFSSEGSFSCQHLLRLGTSVYKVSSEGPAPMSHSGIRTRDSRIIKSLHLRTITLNLNFGCMQGQSWRWPHI
jgi:hypothetical protein